MPMNALQKELVRVGLAQEPKEKRKRYKKFTCHQCGAPMHQVSDTNTMACEKCGQYFIFNKTK